MRLWQKLIDYCISLQVELDCVCDYVCPSSLRRWSLFLFVGFTDPYNHTYFESLWWKLFKNHKRTQIQRRRQWQRQRQRQIHRQSAWKTQHMLYFWNPDDLLIPNLMIDTSPWSSCSRKSPWLDCSGHTISFTGPSVSPFRDFLFLFWDTLFTACMYMSTANCYCIMRFMLFAVMPACCRRNWWTSTISTI